MKTAFNGKSYDILIAGNDIILQGLTEDVEFRNGYQELKDQAEEEFFAMDYAGQRLSSFIAEYIDSNIQNYILFNKGKGVVVKTEAHSLN